MAAGCGPQDIWNALIGAGFSTAQAIGAMANAIAESDLNIEMSGTDTNGYTANGLWSWNEQFFPDSGQLVTGNCRADLASQIGYLKSHISGQALEGATGAQVAGNFAAYMEGCEGCSPGSTYPNGWSTRVANAAIVERWASSGNWPTSSSTGISGSGSGSTSSSASSATLTGTLGGSDCAWAIGGEHIGIIAGHGPSLPAVCLLTKSEVRAMLGGLLILAGGLLVLPGLFMLAAFAFRGSGAQATAGQAGAVLERTPVYGPVIRAARTQSQQRAARRAQPPARVVTVGGSGVRREQT